MKYIVLSLLISTLISTGLSAAIQNEQSDSNSVVQKVEEKVNEQVKSEENVNEEELETLKKNSYEKILKELDDENVQTLFKAIQKIVKPNLSLKLEQILEVLENNYDQLSETSEFINNLPSLEVTDPSRSIKEFHYHFRIVSEVVSTFIKPENRNEVLLGNSDNKEESEEDVESEDDEESAESEDDEENVESEDDKNEDDKNEDDKNEDDKNEDDKNEDDKNEDDKNEVETENNQEESVNTKELEDFVQGLKTFFTERPILVDNFNLVKNAFKKGIEELTNTLEYLNHSELNNESEKMEQLKKVLPYIALAEEEISKYSREDSC